MGYLEAMQHAHIFAIEAVWYFTLWLYIMMLKAL